MIIALQCRSASELHPKTHQPLHFICTSLKQGDSCILAKEEDLIDEGQKEAIATLDAVKKYCANCPKEWGRNMKKSSFLETICIVTPWRNQVQVHVPAGVAMHMLSTQVQKIVHLEIQYMFLTCFRNVLFYGHHSRFVSLAATGPMSH